MYKLLPILTFFVVLFFGNISQVFADSISGQYYPPSNSDYYLVKYSKQLFVSYGSKSLRITQYKYNLPMTEENIVGTQIWSVKENASLWVDIWNRGYVQFQWLDDKGVVLKTELTGNTNVYIKDDGGIPTPSDYNDAEHKYKSDTFGGTQSESVLPSFPDGSGGSGSPSFLGDNDKNKNNIPDNTENPSGGGDDGSGSGTGTDMTETNKKLDDIKKALGDIGSSVNTNGESLNDVLNSIKDSNKSLVSIDNELKNMTSILDTIKGELQGDGSFVSVPSTPGYTVPSGEGLIESNKPVSGNSIFEDNSNYFSDRGNSSDVPSDMPLTPDIKDWDGVTRQSELTSETSLNRNDLLDKDSELTTETSLNRNDLLDKDSELSKDSFIRNEILLQDQFSNTENFLRTNKMTQNHFYTQDTPMVVTE